MIRVDAHHHLWDPTRFRYPWLTDELAAINRPFTAGDLQATTMAAGIDATIAVQTRAAIDETIEFLQSPAPVAGVVGWVDLTAPDVGDVIESLRNGPGGQRLVGIRHQVHDEADANWLDRPDVRRGIHAVVGAGLPFDLLVRTRELPAATRLARDIPQGTFVLDHLAKPPLTQASDSAEMAAWSSAVRDLAACPTVVAKLSGLVTEADWNTWTIEALRPAVLVALDAFGPDRLMFGSDWPVCLVAASYGEVLDAAASLLMQLSTSERAAVFATNAIDTYHLDLPTPISKHS